MNEEPPNIGLGAFGGVFVVCARFPKDKPVSVEPKASKILLLCVVGALKAVVVGVANEPKLLGLPKVGAPPKLGCAPKAGGLPNVGAPPKTGRGKAPACCCCVGEPKPVLAIEEPACENELNGELAVVPKPLAGELNIFDCCCCCGSLAAAAPPNIEPPDAAALLAAAPKAEPTKLKPDAVGAESRLLAAAAEAKIPPVD